jgi:hypothetical protein
LCHRHGADAQAGQYTFNITPPSILPDAVVVGSPMALNVHPGPPDPANSNVSAAVPANPTLGAVVTVEVSLADVYGNPVTANDAAQYNTTKLVLNGG